jgi:hypothetical protein
MTPLAVRAADIWVYLAASPLLWLTITLAAYAAADRFAASLGRPAYANPVLFAAAILVAILLACWVPRPSHSPCRFTATCRKCALPSSPCSRRFSAAR